tara:strand:+ start:451 stop:660 length:210 start_codon:yes stop_codon:yes gene_type:complete
MELFYDILIIILLINGLFWSLATHSEHCALGRLFNIKKCLSHGTHIIIGIVSLLVAIIIKQRDYFKKFI